MADPAIKAALEAAERETTTPGKVAAFLRALPGHYITQGLDGFFTTTGWFAAAVEEAASDG